MSTISSSTTTTTAYKVTADTTGALVLQTGATPTTAVTIDTSQNVGIGTTSPASKLNISDTSANSLRISGAGDHALGFTGYSGNSATQIFSIRNDGNSNVYINTQNSIPLSFGVSTGTTFGSTTEAMRIDSSGNLLVGTTSQIQGGKLSVAGVITSQNSGAGFSANQTNATGDQFYFRTSSGANLAGYITCPTSTTTSYASVSDYRLKENVAPMTGALEKIALLKPCTYTWKTDRTDGQGFIAHELQAVVPDCVHGEKDGTEIYTDEDGNEQTRPKYQGIDTSFLVATLTAAIQEQQTIITALTARITALETK